MTKSSPRSKSRAAPIAAEPTRAKARLRDVPLAEIAPAHLVRDRVTLDPGDLAALKASIAQYGQRVPAEIVPLPKAARKAGPYRYGLVSGWRRLRAIAELYNETDDPRFATLRAQLQPRREAGGDYVAMVEENDLRVGLSPYERARVAVEATERGAFPDTATALRTLFASGSAARRSRIGAFVRLHEALGDVLRFPAAIPERLGLALVEVLKGGGADRLRKALQRATPGTAEEELALLAALTRPKPPPKPRGGEVLRDGVALRAGRRGHRITLVLQGDAVDDDLLDAARAALRALGQG